MKYISVLTLSLIGSLSSFAGYSTNVVETTLRGKILDLKSHAPVNATVDVYYNSDFIKEFSVNTTLGEFNLPIRDFGWFLISVTSPGYVEASDTVWVVNDKRAVIEKDFYVSPIEVGLTMTLNNIYFDFGKARLSEESFPELDKTVNFFNENANVKFEIGGHTDTQGPDDYNLILSQMRTQAVVDYLVHHGASPSQLVAQGYGETRPLDLTKTKAAEAKNRRVEFKVLDMAMTKAR